MLNLVKNVVHINRLHDFDNNTKLDGLEILQAIRHVMHGENEEEQSANAEANQRGNSITKGTDSIDEDDFIYFVELIDQVLEEDDLDDDGFLSYAEYVQGRKNDHIKREKSSQKNTQKYFKCQ
ncbi:hypothetical protein J437_LFUL011596 [Ladona fulva]|uniref:EF-hand domain-containing protein n=1 Tax=Ladona fulva TaxID=123851 RepID=A0A8K0KPI0_LADFU|nr:hypothetical protein J437_LFUL011596 [Ladona fulva]